MDNGIRRKTDTTEKNAVEDLGYLEEDDGLVNSNE